MESLYSIIINRIEPTGEISITKTMALLASDMTSFGFFEARHTPFHAIYFRREAYDRRRVSSAGDNRRICRLRDAPRK